MYVFTIVKSNQNKIGFGENETKEDRVKIPIEELN